MSVHELSCLSRPFTLKEGSRYASFRGLFNVHFKKQLFVKHHVQLSDIKINLKANRFTYDSFFQTFLYFLSFSLSFLLSFFLSFFFLSFNILEWTDCFLSFFLSFFLLIFLRGPISFFLSFFLSFF